MGSSLGNKMALTDTQIHNKVQIIYWEKSAISINCKEGEVKIYDSVFNSCDEETKLVVRNIFQADTAKQSPRIKVMYCDCGGMCNCYSLRVKSWKDRI